ncbi:hypothetical protein [Fulvimarina sp. MAC8]|uniref:hypothetical protein n=1 Tax=Fulvimarina sp. MAC8 TaxID=3162874 RepID=UPI0032EF8A85
MRARDDSAYDDAMNPPPPETGSDNTQKGSAKQERNKGYEESDIDEALDETFPASDPIAPSRIDGPGN